MRYFISRNFVYHISGHLKSTRETRSRELPRETLIFSVWVWIVVSRVNRSEIWNFYNFNFSSWSRRPVRSLSGPRQVSLGKRDFELVSPASYARDRRNPLTILSSQGPTDVRVFWHSSEKFNFLHVTREDPEKAQLNESSVANLSSRNGTNCIVYLYFK